MDESEDDDDGGVILSTDEPDVRRDEDSVDDIGGDARAACGGSRLAASVPAVIGVSGEGGGFGC